MTCSGGNHDGFGVFFQGPLDFLAQMSGVHSAAIVDVDEVDIGRADAQ